MTASPLTIVEHDLYAPEFSSIDRLLPTNPPSSLKTSLSTNLFLKSSAVVLIKSRWSASILCSQKIPSKPSAQAHSNTFYGFDYDLKKTSESKPSVKIIFDYETGLSIIRMSLFDAHPTILTRIPIACRKFIRIILI